nr:MAG: replication associated protein [Arizlama virus]
MEQPAVFKLAVKRKGAISQTGQKPNKRLVCTTIFDMDYGAKIQEFVDKGKIQFAAYGHEVCPKTGRPHLQAFAYSKYEKEESAWRKLFKPHHLQLCRGNLHQNERYCSKTGDYTEIGIKPMGDGKKRSLEEYCDRIIQGEQTEEIALDIPQTYVQYERGLKSLERCVVNKRLKSISRDFAPTVTYIWGPPGSGKTSYARNYEATNFGKEIYDCDEADLYKWKDGYKGDEAVLYDNVEEVHRTRFLKEIDRYLIQAPVKGGYVYWRPLRIYITSVFSPDEFSYKFTHRDELLRRITTVVELKKFTPSE